MVPQSAALVEACLSNVEIIEKKEHARITKHFQRREIIHAFRIWYPSAVVGAPLSNVFQGTEFRAHRKPGWQVTARAR
jgi:hypothetical protein